MPPLRFSVSENESLTLWQPDVRLSLPGEVVSVDDRSEFSACTARSRAQLDKKARVLGTRRAGERASSATTCVMQSRWSR